MNKIPKEHLEEQLRTVNFTIAEKEKKLQELSNPTQFVLNKEVSNIIQELKDLNSQRVEIKNLLEDVEE